MTPKSGKAAGFTLIELLVVIAIIGVLAALTLPVMHSVARTKYISVTKAEMGQLETAIDNYHAAYGFYPPCNATNELFNQLYYELTGTTYINPANPAYQPSDGSVAAVPAINVQRTYDIGGFMNCNKPGGDETAVGARDFLPALKPSEVYGPLTNGNTGPQGVVFLVSSVGGPDTAYAPLAFAGLNPWRYNSSSPKHNPVTYDLYIQLRIDGKTNLICNWNSAVQINSPLP